MNRILTGAVSALSLGAMVLSASPAAADHGHGKGRGHERGEGHWKAKGNGHWKHGDDRRVVVVRDRAPARVVHVYDYNRPDPRFHGYYANRYYTPGYRAIPVTRSTRIYRGDNDRYYCRRSDGTTGLIVGAALGGVLGNQIARGESRTIATVLGAGAGALLGREIDRGELVCR